MSMPFSQLWLLPVGDAPAAPIKELAGDLSSILGLDTRIASTRLSMPEDSYDPRRGQSLAPRLLQRLRTIRGDSDALVLGVAHGDLYAPGLSFVFGQADIAGGVSVISLNRLYPAFYGRLHDMATFRRRTAIEGVHEVGHLLGIAHCPDRHCVMFFSSTMADSDRKGPLFCPNCRDLASRAVVPAQEIAASNAAVADGPLELV